MRSAFSARLLQIFVLSRPIDGELQDVSTLASYLAQFPPHRFLEAASDFHFLLYIATMDMFPLMVCLYSLSMTACELNLKYGFYNRRAWICCWRQSVLKTWSWLTSGRRVTSGERLHNFWLMRTRFQWEAGLARKE